MTAVFNYIQPLFPSNTPSDILFFTTSSLSEKILKCTLWAYQCRILNILQYLLNLILRFLELNSLSFKVINSSIHSLFPLYAPVAKDGRVLSWEERLQIAVDISHGIEYLHEGVCLSN